MTTAVNLSPARRPDAKPATCSLLPAFEKAEIGEGSRDWRVLLDGGIEFACDHSDPLLLVSEVDIESRPDTWIHVEIDLEYEAPAGIELPARLHAQLFYNEDRSRSFREQRTVVDALDPGASRHRARFRFRSYRPTRIRQLRFDPVNAPGLYRILGARY
ncbi:MAG: hypothetical protein KC466_07985, partial [Myxococcales bacterium]|nr:hypothetical protein [Myxococcales bacterium]